MRRNRAEDRPPPLGGGGPGSSAPGYGERRRGERRMFTHFTRRRETAMRRMAVALGILGLVCAVALPASAATQIKIFGQNYNVVKQSRAQTYKNGVAIHLDDGLDGVNSYAGVSFSEGKDASSDRLWFGARIDSNADSKGDQL